ncbi:uncharacterized protein LOC131435998 [Malaya genurostris]|uniref:uncharacterized protein LOC131435998 n=1 Tax=Malaya genurostris TaxID=325434 RepID=UPI0026F40282|nr:uncharacterized protein LOC131435998 [Malaya genurostris]XP_058460339.1 uncharacterized protein LOC131435998 [Malaya genurostris]
MHNQDILIAKYTEHRKVHERFLLLFDNLQRTAAEMQVLASDVTRYYDDISIQLKKMCNQAYSSPPSNKRKKARSFDSPFTGTPYEDCSSGRNKSDPEMSSSVLNQNINLPDSDDSFLALSQSPSRVPLSPKQKDNVQHTPPKKNWFKTELCQGIFSKDDKKVLHSDSKSKKKHNLSLIRFSSTIQSSPESLRQIEHLPRRQKMVTTKPVAIAQLENLIPPGKWTAKKSTPGSVRKMGSSVRKTPISTENDTLLNRTRFRQTRLRFPDNLSKSTDSDDFVIPSPAPLGASRFLKSAKKKGESSVVEKQSNESREDDFDIDQTYFSEVEKDLIRQTEKSSSTEFIVKKELSQLKTSSTNKKLIILAKETQAQEDSDTDSILFVKPPADEIIVIDATQPNKNDLFMDAIREQGIKEIKTTNSLLSNVDTMKEVPGAPPVGSTLSDLRRCAECAKYYQFLVDCDLPENVIRSKMTRNCRGCRDAQLHETPAGFWNPEFSLSP